VERAFTPRACRTCGQWHDVKEKMCTRQAPASIPPIVSARSSGSLIALPAFFSFRPRDSDFKAPTQIIPCFPAYNHLHPSNSTESTPFTSYLLVLALSGGRSLLPLHSTCLTALPGFLHTSERSFLPRRSLYQHCRIGASITYAADPLTLAPVSSPLLPSLTPLTNAYPSYYWKTLAPLP
jgi:hypothetical protein